MRSVVTTRRREGFTVVETAAVAGLVSIIMSVALPAVQQARTAARDVECRNRLKQIGLALHNYHDVYGMFPPGWISKRMSGEGHPSNGWMTGVLPFVDEAPLYNKLNVNDVYETQDLSLLKTDLKRFRCTSDSLAGSNPLRGGWGTANISGNYGPRPIARWSASDFWPGQPQVHLGRRREITAGIFEMNRGTRIRDVLDGTSNTIMVGEKCVVSNSGIWPGPRSNYHESDGVSDLSYSSPLNRSETGFSSRHLGNIVYFCLCDGSVRPIFEGVESLPVDEAHPNGGLLQGLAGRNDGMILGRDVF